jgi:hypothetical protein
MKVAKSDPGLSGGVAAPTKNHLGDTRQRGKTQMVNNQLVIKKYQLRIDY